jgi:hypothetical protein
MKDYVEPLYLYVHNDATHNRVKVDRSTERPQTVAFRVAEQMGLDPGRTRYRLQNVRDSRRVEAWDDLNGKDVRLIETEVPETLEMTRVELNERLREARLSGANNELDAVARTLECIAAGVEEAIAVEDDHGEKMRLIGKTAAFYEAANLLRKRHE